MKRKGVRAVRQGLRIVPGGQQMPAAFAHSGQSHPQIVTKRRAKGKLVAPGDRDLIQDRPAPGATAFHQPPQCGHFRGKRTGLTLCLGPCDAGGGFDRLGLGAGGLGGGQRVLGGFGAPGGGFLRLFRHGKCFFGCGAGLGRAVGTGLCVGGGADDLREHAERRARAHRIAAARPDLAAVAAVMERAEELVAKARLADARGGGDEHRASRRDSSTSSE